VAKPAATADVQRTLKDRFREYTEALTKRDLSESGMRPKAPSASCDGW
jgi:hypothetical protein